MRLRPRLAAAACALVLAATPRNGLACATCGCGDPTITAMGAEKPYRDRLRASLDARVRTDAIGQPDVDRLELREIRLDGQLSWALVDRIVVLGTVPALRRQIRYVNEGSRETTALGDVELRAKAFVFVDRDFDARHLVALTAGIKVPSAPREKGADGTYLPVEAQPGTGSWDPLLGASYAFFARPFSLYASVQAAYPLRGTSVYRASASVRTTTMMQVQLAPWIAPRLGVDTRTDGRSFEDGRAERDSSGFVGYVSPEVLLRPVDDLVVVLSLRLPVLQALAGYHREGPIAGVAIAYDL